MSIVPVIKAPLPIQVYRVLFAGCAIFVGSFVWQERRIGSFAGLMELDGFAFFSLLGFVYTCVRTRRARWILALLGILIPAVLLACLISFVLRWPTW